MVTRLAKKFIALISVDFFQQAMDSTANISPVNKYKGFYCYFWLV
jgi:hypothetical protein